MPKLTIPYQRAGNGAQTAVETAKMQFCKQLMEEVSQMASGKRASLSPSLARKSVELQMPALKEKLESVSLENLRTSSYQLCSVFASYGIYFNYLDLKSVFYYTYGNIGQKANVDGIDFFWLNNFQGNTPLGEALSVYTYDSGNKDRLAYVMFYDEQAGGYPVSHEIAFFFKLLSGAEEAQITNPLYSPLMMKFASFANEKYSLMEKKDAVLELEKDRSIALAASQIHTTVEKKYIFETPGLPSTAISYVQNGGADKTMIRMLSEILFAPNPFYTLFQIWKTAAETTRQGVIGFLTDRPDQREASVMLANVLPRVTEFGFVKEGYVKELRTMALEILSAFYQQIFQREFDYHKSFQVGEILDKLMKLAE